ncbi:hypothetical protein ABPG72_009938 [Tetrahymena utriculariae]
MSQIDQKLKVISKRKSQQEIIQIAKIQKKIKQGNLTNQVQEKNLRQAQVVISKRKSYKDEILKDILEDKVTKIIQILLAITNGISLKNLIQKKELIRKIYFQQQLLKEKNDYEKTQEQFPKEKASKKDLNSNILKQKLLKRKQNQLIGESYGEKLERNKKSIKQYLKDQLISQNK